MSHAVQLARAEAIAAYPITPQTHIVEHLSSLVANGELEAEFVNVESEHSAISACIGMSASGARTYTATSSQGLALMNEILFIASAMRFPIVMTVANRALSGPLEHLERPLGHHGGPGHRLDSGLCGERPGGLRPLHHGLQDCRRTPRCCSPPSSTWTASSSPTWWKPWKWWTRKRWTSFCPLTAPGTNWTPSTR